MKKLTEITDALRKALSSVLSAIDLRDMHAYGGLLMLGYGINIVYPPAAWAIGGALLFWMGVRR